MNTGIIDVVTERIKRLRQNMGRESIDVLLINQPENRLYFSGFSGSNGWLYITRDKISIVTDGRYFSQVEKEAPAFELLKSPQDYMLIETLAGHIKENKALRYIGIESNSMNVATYQKLTEILPGRILLPADSLIETPRLTKEPFEMNEIRKAVKYAESAFIKLKDKIVAGVSEREISAHLQFLMKMEGADKEAFDIIVASGPNGAYPHARPTDRILQEGDCVTIDWGAKINNYHSDMTRSLFTGKPTSEMQKIYDTVLQAQFMALNGAGPDMSAGDLDKLARDLITEKGYGDYYIHGLGHGVGLAIHEGPRIKKGEKEILQPGMVITIEPGIYIPGTGGVRIEDMVMITEDGCEILTSLPK